MGGDVKEGAWRLSRQKPGDVISDILSNVLVLLAEVLDMGLRVIKHLRVLENSLDELRSFAGIFFYKTDLSTFYKTDIAVFLAFDVVIGEEGFLGSDGFEDDVGSGFANN